MILQTRYHDWMIKRLSTLSWYPWLVWALGAAFFFAEYFARVAPSITVPQLMQAFQVDALSLGVIAGFFYYAYISMQLAVGVLVDRFKPHRLLSAMAGVCAFACFLFAMSNNAVLASASRFLMGFGAAFAFVGTLKLATLWFSPERFGLLAGLTQALGMLGAAVGAGPFSTVVTRIGWRETMWIIGGILLVLAFLIALLVRDRPESRLQKQAHIHEKGLLTSLTIVLCNRQTWLNGFSAGFLYAPTAVFAELWGVSYLVRVYDLHTHVAASAISTIFIGWAVGAPFFGWLSDRIKRRRPLVLSSALLSLFFIAAILYLPRVPLPLLFVLLFLYGFSNTGVTTTYAISAEINPRAVAGTSVAFTNMASVLIGAAFQPIIGWFLDLQWKGVIANGARVYSAETFQHAMLILPIFCFLSWVFAMLTRETYCKQVNEVP